jgi:predicted RNA binding protein YcfA (HicA-like mRNA interferase family)
MDHLPSLTPKKLLRVLGKLGFVVDHYRGGHAYLTHPRRGLRTCIPMHNREISRGLLKTILKQVQISTEEFRKII